MADDNESEPVSFEPANDNQGRESDRQTRQRVDRVVLTIARLIGRRIAREQFAALSVPNDNTPQAVQEDGADKE